MSRQNKYVQTFTGITQTTDEVARFYMNHYYDVNQAVDAFYNNLC